MLMLLSPAKTLDYDTPVRTRLTSTPPFLDEAAGLMRALVTLSADDLVQLMRISPALAALNVRRYAAWRPESDVSTARQAVLAFNGDVYEGLQAASLSDAQLQWAQQHLVILSGLYGVLRPLDLMRPYRLEMGSRLHTARGATLYDWWGNTVAEYLNAQLAEHANPWVLNLASEEYVKVVRTQALRAPMVQCVFQDNKNGAWKLISFYAKRARGLMARYVIEHGVQAPEALRGFAAEGYAFAPEVSTDVKLVFRRAL